MSFQHMKYLIEGFKINVPKKKTPKQTLATTEKKCGGFYFTKSFYNT